MFARSVKLRYGAPLLNRRPVSVIFVPCFMVLGVHPKFLNQAGVKTDFVRLETVGISGNSHMMMLEKNSDDVIKFIVSWLQKNLSTT